MSGSKTTIWSGGCIFAMYTLIMQIAFDYKAPKVKLGPSFLNT